MLTSKLRNKKEFRYAKVEQTKEIVLSQESTITYDIIDQTNKKPLVPVFEYNLDDKGFIKSNDIFDFEKCQMLTQRFDCLNSIIVSEKNYEEGESLFKNDDSPQEKVELADDIQLQPGHNPYA